MGQAERDRSRALREVDAEFWEIRQEVDSISGKIADNVVRAIRLTHDTDTPAMILWKHNEMEKALMKFRAEIIRLRETVRNENRDVGWQN